MSAIDPTLLDEGSSVPDEDTLLAADPSGSRLLVCFAGS